MPKRMSTHGKPKSRFKSHAKAVAKRDETLRCNRKSKTYDHTWKTLRAHFLAVNPNCRSCGKMAVHADHIKPVREHPELRLNLNNLQPLCHSCHSRKTAAEDGGFGNDKK